MFMNFYFLSSVALSLFSAFYLLSGRRPGYWAFSILSIFLFYLLLVYVPSRSLPDSPLYLQYFSGGELAKASADSWDKSMKIYSNILSVLTFNLLSPLQTLAFARLLNFAIYCIALFLVPVGPLGKLIGFSFFYSWVLPYNCFFQVRAGFSYALLLICVILVAKKYHAFGDGGTLAEHKVSFHRPLLDFGILQIEFPRFVDVRLLRDLRIGGFMRMKVSDFFMAVTFCVVFLSSLRLHTSVIMLLAPSMLLPVWGMGARNSRKHPLLMFIRYSVIILGFFLALWLVFSRINFFGFASSVLAALLPSDVAEIASTTTTEGTSMQSYFFHFIRSFFFLYISCVLVIRAPSLFSNCIFFSMIVYASTRLPLVGFFSLARILSPLLLLQILAVMRSVPVLRRGLELLLVALALILLISSQAYSVGEILAKT